jgi:hypothetical protein
MYNPSPWLRPRHNPDNMPIVMEEDNPRRVTPSSQALITTEYYDDWHLVTNKRRQVPHQSMRSTGSSTTDTIVIALQVAIKSATPENRQLLQHEVPDLKDAKGLLPRHANGKMPHPNPGPTTSSQALSVDPKKLST